MEKKIESSRSIETGKAHTPRRVKIPADLKHLQKREATPAESYRRWRAERIEQLKRAAQYGEELATLQREESAEKGV